MKRMCKVMEGRINEQMIRVAADLLRLGTVSKEDIARITGLSLETVNALAEELKGVCA